MVEKLNETITNLFEGQDLSEEFKKKAATLFEAAVSEAVAERLEELKEELNAERQRDLEELEEALDAYLDEIANKWLEENEIAVEDGIKTELAESFLESIRDTMLEHNIDMDESKIDIVEELEARVKELENKYASVLSENVEYKKFIEQKAVEEITEEVTAGMTESEKDRFFTLAENIEFETLDELEEKLSIIAENIKETKGSTKASYKGLYEEVFVPEKTETETKTEATPEIEHLKQAISKYF